MKLILLFLLVSFSLGFVDWKKSRQVQLLLVLIFGMVGAYFFFNQI